MEEKLNKSRTRLLLAAAIVVVGAIVFVPGAWLKPDRFGAWAAGWQALGTIVAFGLAAVAFRRQAQQTQEALTVAHSEAANSGAGLELARLQLDAQRDATKRQYAEQVSTWLEIATLLDKPELADTMADERYLIASSLAEAEAVPLRVLVLVVTNRGGQPAFEARLSVRWDTATSADQEIFQRSFPVIPPTSQQELRVDSSNSAIIDAFAHHSESLRVELTFRDVAGAWWRRSTTGVLEAIIQP